MANDQLTLGLNCSSMDSRWNVDPESCLDAATLALLSDPVGVTADFRFQARPLVFADVVRLSHCSET